MPRVPSESYNKYAARMDKELEDYGWDCPTDRERTEADAKRAAEIKAMEVALNSYNRASKRVIPSTNPCREVFVGNNPIHTINNVSGAANLSDWMTGNDHTTIRGGTLISDGAITSAQIAANTISSGKTQMTDFSFSTARGDVTVSQSFGQGLKVDFDEAVWTINVPGVLKEEIKVFTVKDRVYVDIEKAGVRQNRFQFLLAEDEKVTATKLDLGILSVTIDRPAKRQEIEVG